MWPDCATDADGLALLRSALAHPSDALPRLILADWLQEHDEEPVADALRWSLERTAQSPVITPVWRALPDAVLARWTPWNVCADGWLGTSVRREQWPVALPDSAWLTSLRLNATGVTDAELERLGALPHLTALGLRSTHVTDAGLPHLAAHAHLLHLDLGFSRISDAGLERLAPLTSLKSLDLFSTRVTDAGLKCLAAVPYLTALDLSGTRVTDAGLEHLAALPGLTVLGLSGERVTDEGRAAFRAARPSCAVIYRN